MTELQTLSPDARAARSASMTPRRGQALAAVLLLASSLLCGPLDALAQAARRSGDYIVAVVNQELVTNSEVQLRLLRAEQEASSNNTRLPDRDTLMRELLDQLIDERAQLGAARDGGVRVDEAEIDRAVTNVAAQNKITVPQLRERLRTEGMDFARFRNNLRDQILLERIREREVQSRTRITDADIEAWLAEQREKNGAATEYNIAQILLSVPESASPAVVTQRRQQGVSLLQRLRSGEDFAALVREASDGSKDRGGEIGLRRADKLPDLYIEAVGSLRVGEVAPQVLRSGAGFHVLKLVERREAALTVQQQHARHILLRPGPKLTQDAAVRRLAGYKRQIEAGTAKFEDLARQHSEDGSAASGGDLGWAAPGQFVPEFEQTMSALRPGSIHLIQLLERRDQRLEPREQREMARAALREQKAEDAYADWAREVRARAYVELRDPPGQ
jgi:peptidyl-prolyl cis-trans isomerase SurA